VLSIELLAQVLKACTDHYTLSEAAEITIEANPGSASPTLLRELRALGVNRLSLGVQSFDEANLALLGRVHSAKEARESYTLAREAGFDNINLDLMYGLPGQDLFQWEADITSALSLGPEHISLYCLSVEENTPLAARISQGELPAPDPDVAADMYEIGQGELARAGYVHYERCTDASVDTTWSTGIMSRISASVPALILTTERSATAMCSPHRSTCSVWLAEGKWSPIERRSTAPRR
jgi:oxygen-independent coproporphyrinogen-3 oxidase